MLARVVLPIVLVLGSVCAALLAVVLVSALQVDAARRKGRKHRR